MRKYVIEHWRDGELIESVKLTKDMFKPLKNGAVRVTIPAGCITLATQDELRFDPESVREIL